MILLFSYALAEESSLEFGRIADLGPMLFGVLLPLALCLYIVRTWVRWFRIEPRLVEPKWKSRITVFGFAASNVAVAIIFAIIFRDAAGNSFQPSDSTLAIALLSILASALLATVAALIGTGPLRFPTVVCSVLCLIVLFIHGLAA